MKLFSRARQDEPRDEGVLSIFLREGRLYLEPYHQTPGPWMSSGEITVLDAAGTGDAALGAAIVAGVSNPRIVAYEKPRGLEHERPLMRAAHVLSWKEFMERAVHAQVDRRGDGWSVQAWRRDGRGLVPEGTARELIDPTPEMIGRAARAALERAGHSEGLVA